MAFCEECGSPLSPGSLFCDECGCKLSADVIQMLQGGKISAIADYGILYTNLKLLSEQLSESIEIIKETLNDFINDAASRYIGYDLIDVSSMVNGQGTVQDHLKIIKTKLKEKNYKYLFIIGSSSVIPSMIWDNYACDSESDPDISSDLPYSTLDTTNPFEGQFYNFNDTLRVGRLPINDLSFYFKNLKESCGKITNIKTFGLSAEVWTEETKHIYSKVMSGPNVYKSPDITVQNFKTVIPEDTNLMLFNLHGSSQTQYWYGQKGSAYPEALDHFSLSKIKNPYFLAVEACYGAAYENRLVCNSILLSSLSGKCISFLGSSRIAFGKPSPEGSCADILCGEYLVNLKRNLSAGDSLEEARSSLMQGENSAEVVKTLAEFSLYGDPSARVYGMPETKKGMESTKSIPISNRINIAMPDVRRAVKMQLIEVDQKIESIAEEFFRLHYGCFSNAKPKFYGNGKNNINAVFQLDSSIGKHLVSIQMNEQGKISNYLETK